MAVVYVPRNESVEHWYADCWEATFIAFLHKSVGLPTAKCGDFLRIPASAPAAATVVASVKIGKLTYEQIVKIMKSEYRYEAGPYEKVDVARKWQKFLHECGGYVS